MLNKDISGSQSVTLHYQDWTWVILRGHKVGGAALGLSCEACFEALASVYASAGACIGRHDASLHNQLYITLFGH